MMNNTTSVRFHENKKKHQDCSLDVLGVLKNSGYMSITLAHCYNTDNANDFLKVNND